MTRLGARPAAARGAARRRDLTGFLVRIKEPARYSPCAAIIQVVSSIESRPYQGFGLGNGLFHNKDANHRSNRPIAPGRRDHDSA
ncbi:MAG: hypothetical protein OSB03_10165 [Vicinamibacterales bacterium]|nr:hypothetical protein [Vicinamibacterales bacterium]